ncbi:MAG: ribosome-binding factor A [Candidatus Tectimicrobiota bacterium]|nr:MAG: ribosome-binding factor A [Candidatus Tectomicrobia bacterium]
MTRYRPVRVGELLQAEIADLLLRQLKDPRLRMATVSRVEVSPDLRHAAVYISRVGDEAEQQATMAAFARASGFIRGQLGKRLKLRYVPQLTFKLDTAIAYGVRISRLLHDLFPDEAEES